MVRKRWFPPDTNLVGPNLKYKDERVYVAARRRHPDLPRSFSAARGVLTFFDEVGREMLVLGPSSTIRVRRDFRFRNALRDQRHMMQIMDGGEVIYELAPLPLRLDQSRRVLLGNGWRSARSRRRFLDLIPPDDSSTRGSSGDEELE